MTSISPIGTRKTRSCFGVMLFVAHFLAFAQNLRRYAVGYGGSWNFWLDADWSPPLPSWFLLVAYAVLLVALALWFWAGTEERANDRPTADVQLPGLE